MVGSEFDGNTTAWINPATVHDVGGVMVRGIFSWHMVLSGKYGPETQECLQCLLQ